jgi:pilus assembly protein Flp/PilA
VISLAVASSDLRHNRQTLSRPGVSSVNKIADFLANEDGATAIEYALIASLIAMVIVASVTSIGTTLSSKFAQVAGSVK